MSAPRRGSILFLGAFVGATPTRANADEEVKRACLEAFDRAQVSRREGKLEAARADLASCAREACPRLVREDCMAMMPDVLASQPTVVLAARDDQGRDLSEVRVSMDGAPVAASLDGKPIVVDPGVHVFRFERAAGGSLETEVVLLAGQKNRLVELVFSEPTPPPPTGLTPSERPAAPVPAPKPEASAPASARPPWYGWAIGGAGVASLGAALVLDVSTSVQVDDFRRTCAPACDPGAVDALRTRYIVAGVVAGIGFTSLGVAAIVLFAGRGRSAGATQAGVAPTPGGAIAHFSARF